MKRFIGMLIIALLVGAVGTPPRGAEAQGACEAAAAMAPGLIGAEAIGVVGDRTSSMFDRIGAQVDQAGTDPDATAAGVQAQPTPSRPEREASNEPAPAPVGC